VVAVPALVFTKISKADISEVFDGQMVLLMVGGAIVFFGLVWLVSYLVIGEPPSRGPFIQGAVRGNNAIVSLAIIINLFSESAVSKATILLAFIMPLYNALSVVILTLTMHRHRGAGLGRLLKRIATNPIILAILVALPFSYFSVKLPLIVDRSLGYLAQMTLPLALLNIGASLRRSSMARPLPAILASVIKLVIYPVVMTAAAVWLGLRGQRLGVLFVFFAAPTAVLSFIMAEAMGNDSELAANIVALTTLSSMFTIGLGLFALRALGLV
jgi:predicted permease